MVDAYEVMTRACETFSRQLRKKRREAGLSLAALARVAGVRKQTIDNWERGRHMPSLAGLVLVSLALKVPVSRLIGQKRERRLPMSPVKKEARKCD